MGEIFAGRYELIDQIGEGGMGSVWRVHDHRSQRLVAAKMLRQSDAGSLLRFMREQGMRIEHSHVVTPLGWAGEDGRVIFTMPLLDGGSLSDVIKEHAPLPYPFVAEVLRQMLDGLDACHRAGIVHRDIKPGNVLLEATGTGRPSVWITDFGIAVSVDAPRLTSQGMVMGTPGYMSPEQAAGADPDPRQDLYSAGMVGLHMLTGLKPASTTRTRADDLPPRPVDVPDSFWNLLAAMCDPVVGKRPASARDALTWLQLPEVAWQDSAARDVPNRLPPIETSGDFLMVDAAAAGRAQDGYRDGSSAPASLLSQWAARGNRSATPPSGMGATAGAHPMRGAASSKRWMAVPAAMLVALATIFGLWQPWGPADGGSDAQHANTGGACYFSDVGTVATTKSGTELTCTYADGRYTWTK